MSTCEVVRLPTYKMYVDVYNVEGFKIGKWELYARTLDAAELEAEHLAAKNMWLYWQVYKEWDK